MSRLGKTETATDDNTAGDPPGVAGAAGTTETANRTGGPTTKKICHIRKTIDFIMIEEEYKHTLTNARTYQGTLTESDHRLLITSINITSWKFVHKNKNANTKNKNQKYDTQKLVNDKNIQTILRMEYASGC